MRGSIAILTVLSAFLITGCATSIGTQESASYSIPGQPPSLVFRSAVQAVVASGLSLTSSDFDAGVIVAEASRNPMLTYENTRLNIIVNSSGSGSLVTVSATLGGQVVDYGSASSAVARFCNSFQGSYPSYVRC